LEKRGTGREKRARTLVPRRRHRPRREQEGLIRREKTYLTETRKIEESGTPVKKGSATLDTHP